MDSEPTKMSFAQNPEKIMRLRPRDLSKEIQSIFRHRAKNTIERVYESLSMRSPSGQTPEQLMRRSQQLESKL